MTGAYEDLRVLEVPIGRVCTLIGRSRATHYRDLGQYLHDFPQSFGSLADARQYLEGFFTEYNHIHRRCGIGWHTPASVHFGTHAAVDDARRITLNAATRPTQPGSAADPPHRKSRHRLHQRTRTRTPNQLISTVSFDLTNSGHAER